MTGLAVGKLPHERHDFFKIGWLWNERVGAESIRHRAAVLARRNHDKRNVREIVARELLRAKCLAGHTRQHQIDEQDRRMMLLQPHQCFGPIVGRRDAKSLPRKKKDDDVPKIAVVFDQEYIDRPHVDRSRKSAATRLTRTVVQMRAARSMRRRVRTAAQYGFSSLFCDFP